MNSESGSVGAEPLEMYLCEASAVVLKPQTYRFVVDPNCDECKRIEIDGKIPEPSQAGDSTLPADTEAMSGEPEDLDELLLGAIEHLEWHGLALGKEASADKEPPRWSAFQLWKHLTEARTALAPAVEQSPDEVMVEIQILVNNLKNAVKAIETAAELLGTMVPTYAEAEDNDPVEI